MWLSLLFIGFIYPFISCLYEGQLRIYSPGDIIIGGLFPVHTLSSRKGTPVVITCINYDVPTVLQIESMIFAIQEINQRRPPLLPGITIGYDIYDTCGDISYAISAALTLMGSEPNHDGCLTPERDDSAPHAQVVIGERYSEVSVSVARLFALSSVTQISYGSTSKALSEKFNFPSFLRTIPSDVKQTKAMAAFIERVNWKSIGVIGSNDEYGKYGSEGLVDLLNVKEVCVDFKKIVSVSFSTKDDTSELDELMRTISSSSAEAIVLFTKNANIYVIIQAAVRLNISRTWIASDSWSTSMKIMKMPRVQNIGQVFGFAPKGNKVPGFEEYVAKLDLRTTNPFHQRLWCYWKNCSDSTQGSDVGLSNASLPDSCPNSGSSNQSKCLKHDLVKYIKQDQTYAVYLAVNTIAEGLRSLLRCNGQNCERNTSFHAWELLEEIKKVNCTVSNTELYFDSNGDPSLGYDILEWVQNNTEFRVIGEYEEGLRIFDSSLHLTEELCNVTVTAFNCYKACAPGYELKLQKRCCKTCSRCEDGYYSNGGVSQCKPCKLQEYASEQGHKCLTKRKTFIEWSEQLAIILMTFQYLGIVVTILVAILLTIHRKTPIVKAIGGYLCFLELLSLLACFCSIGTFIGKPSNTLCQAGLPLFGLAFTLCVACILANLFQIFVGFSFDQQRATWMKRLCQPMVVVPVCFCIQVALCVVWLTYKPPSMSRDVQKRVILILCAKGSNGLFISMVSYIALLALVCFFFAFKGKRLPDLYKNASFITISMLIFLVVWMLFIPIYIYSKGKYTRYIEAAAILVSTYGILCCHFAPKGYIILFKKEINNENAITEYIRKHLEKKGVSIALS